MTAHYQKLLQDGLSTMGMAATPSQQEHLLNFLTMLEEWNRAFNLTAVKGIANMIGRHLLDSLAILPYVHGERIIDVGTGAGLPGIPLSILLPDKHFVLLDSNQKKQ